MLSIWFLWSLLRLDTLILNQNSFGCEGVANLCEELAKCGAQNRILQDSRYSRYSAHIFITEKTCWHVSLVFLAKVRCWTNFEFFFVGTKSFGWFQMVFRCTRLRVLELEGCNIQLERMPFFSVENRFFSVSLHIFKHFSKWVFRFSVFSSIFENRIIWNIPGGSQSVERSPEDRQNTTNLHFWTFGIYFVWISIFWSQSNLKCDS